jgi:hypothetical protein
VQKAARNVSHPILGEGKLKKKADLKWKKQRLVSDEP